MNFDDWEQYKSIDKERIELRVSQLDDDIKKLIQTMDLFLEMAIKDTSKNMYAELQSMLINMEEE
tara:strand:+ start:173 stop:367 length:195 start_codon:yes stop_codon:yes gene_type:complete